MTTLNIGYKRVSTYSQNTARQLDGLELDRIYEDKVSGSSTNRPQLAAMLDHLRAGDTIHVHSIDRLARNLLDLMNLIETIVGKGASVKFHRESMTFSGEDEPAQQMMLQMMGAVAQFERIMINERAAEGRAIAIAKGVVFGPAPAISDKEAREIRQLISQGKTISAIARDYDASRATIHRALKRLENQSSTKLPN